jgi:hypothetical protein
MVIINLKLTYLPDNCFFTNANNYYVHLNSDNPPLPDFFKLKNQLTNQHISVPLTPQESANEPQTAVGQKHEGKY